MVKTVTKPIVLSLALTFIQAQGAAPSNLPWPVDGKGVEDTTFFFGVDDSVNMPNHVRDNRTNCRNGRYVPHVGVDIAVNPGTPVKAIGDGEAFLASDPNWGKAVAIKHSGWTSIYWHITPKVSKKQRVKAGEVIGTVTSTTNMNDINHLHLGIASSSDGDYVKGYLGCGLKDYRPYTNPFYHLRYSSHIILDDAGNVSYHPAAWIESRQKDFYYGSGYRAIDITKHKNAAARFKSGKFVSAHRYNIYVRLTPGNDYTSEAIYTLSKNGKFVESIKMSQQSGIKRGQNRILFSNVTVKAGDSIDILVKNNGYGRYMAVDAFILVDK